MEQRGHLTAPVAYGGTVTEALFDDSALRLQVDQEAARSEGEAALVADGRTGQRRWTVVWAVFQSVVLIVGFGLLGSLLVMVVQSVFGRSGSGPSTFVIGFLMVVPLAVMRIRATTLSLRRDTWIVQYRLRRFAAANALTYEPVVTDPEPVASIIRRFGGVSTDRLTGRRPRAFQVALHHYDSEPIGRTRMPQVACYLAVDTRQPIPEFTVSSLSAPPVARPPREHRAVEIAGPLAEGFRVVCAPGAEAAVRAVLTDTIQQMIADVARRGAVESSGGRIAFLAPRDVRMDSPALWEWVVDAIRTAQGLGGVVGEAEGGAAVNTGESHGGADALREQRARSERREQLFALPRDGRPLLGGCVVPVILGLVVAAVLAVTGG